MLFGISNASGEWNTEPIYVILGPFSYILLRETGKYIITSNSSQWGDTTIDVKNDTGHHSIKFNFQQEPMGPLY